MSVSIKDGGTAKVFDALNRCEEMEEVYSVIENHTDHKIRWRSFIRNRISLCGHTIQSFSKLCGLGYHTVAAWCRNGVLPRTRNQFIRAGFALRMNLETLNEFLQRYGRYPKLYAKSLEDSLYIFALNNGLSFEQSVKLQEQYCFVSENIRNLRKKKDRAKFLTETFHVQDRLLSLHSVRELERFIENHCAAFADGYTKLLDFIDTYVQISAYDFAEGKAESLQRFLTSQIQNLGIANAFSTMISRLRTASAVPRRNALIALGVHMNMGLTDLNRLLDYAGMEPLCAKDKVEAVIIYAVEHAILNNPGIELSNAMLAGNFTENPVLRRECLEIIARYENSAYKTLENSRIIDYVTETLETLDSESKNEILSLLDCR